MKSAMKCVVMIFIVLGFTQCQVTSGGDDPTPTPTGVSKTELLAGTSSRAWTITSSKINGKELVIETLPCVRDDNMVFKTDKTYERNEGATKCRDKDPQVYETGSWEFNVGETELILNKEHSYKLLTLNTTTLKISIKNVFGESEELTFKPN